MVLTAAIRSLRDVTDVAGGIPSNSKMPGPSYGLPVASCNVGLRLREIEGTPCHGCYAYEGNFKRFAKTVIPSQERHLEALRDPRWEDAIVFYVETKGVTHWRWHDAGDLQGVWHLLRMARIAERTPDCRYWAPTQERAVLAMYKRQHGELPPNLVVRVSMPKLDSRPTPKMTDENPFSWVLKDRDDYEGHVCPAPKQNGSCGDCRACWDPSVREVAYHIH